LRELGIFVKGGTLAYPTWLIRHDLSDKANGSTVVQNGGIRRGEGGVWRQCRRERTKGGKGEKKGERVLVWLGGWGQEVTASTVRGKGSGSEGSLKGRGGRGFAAREASKEGASGCGYLIGLLWYRGRSGLPADWVGAGLTLPPRRREKSGGGSTSHDAPMSTDSSTSLPVRDVGA